MAEKRSYELSGGPARPEPQKNHLAAAEAQETHSNALRVLVAKGKTHEEAVEHIAKHGADAVMAEHNKPVEAEAAAPSAADLDAVADEQKAAVATAAPEKKSAAWGKAATAKK